MKKNRRVTAGIAVVVGGLLLGSTALAAQRGEMHGAGRETHSNEAADGARGDVSGAVHGEGALDPENDEHGGGAGGEMRRGHGPEDGHGHGHGDGHGDGHGHGAVRALEELVERGELDRDTFEAVRGAMKKMHEAHEQSREEGPVGGEREHMEKLMAELVSKGVVTPAESDLILEKLAQLAMRSGHGEGVRGDHGGADRGASDAMRDWMRDGRDRSGEGARGLDEAENGRSHERP